MLFVLLACADESSVRSELAGDADLPDPSPLSLPPPPTPEWTVETVDTIDPERLTGNVGIAGSGADTWIVWDDANPDQSDDRLHLVAFDGTTEVRHGTLSREDSAAKPSIAVDDDRLVVLRLVGCAEGPCAENDRELVLSTLDRDTGRWSTEPVAPEHAEDDHGQSDVALGPNGDLYVCYVLKLYGRANDDTWCTSRDAAGTWTEPFHLTDGQNGADDHPNVLVPTTGPLRVGYTTMESTGRQAAVWFEEHGDRHVFDSGPATADDVILTQDPDGAIHAVWRSVPGPGFTDFQLHHAVCEAPCVELDRWTPEIVRSVPVPIDALDAVMTADGLLVLTWTEDTAVRVGWVCDDGLRSERPDTGDGEESTERGQPSVRLDPMFDRLHVVYTKVTDEGSEVRWANRTTPTCQ